MCPSPQRKSRAKFRAATRIAKRIGGGEIIIEKTVLTGQNPILESLDRLKQSRLLELAKSQLV